MGTVLSCVSCTPFKLSRSEKIRTLPVYTYLNLNRKTRMHSRRMRTARLLPISPGGVPGPGGRVPGPGGGGEGVYLVRGEG